MVYRDKFAVSKTKIRSKLIKYGMVYHDESAVYKTKIRSKLVKYWMVYDRQITAVASSTAIAASNASNYTDKYCNSVVGTSKTAQHRLCRQILQWHQLSSCHPCHLEFTVCREEVCGVPQRRRVAVNTTVNTTVTTTTVVLSFHSSCIRGIPRKRSWCHKHNDHSIIILVYYFHPRCRVFA